jgi:hypothetical protein
MSIYYEYIFDNFGDYINPHKSPDKTPRADF